MGEIKKSEMCTGYDKGISCIACCVISNICSHNRSFENDFDMLFTIYEGKFTYHNGTYPERKAKVFEKLQEGTKRFNEHPDIEKILKTLKKAESIYATREGIDEFRESDEFKALLDQFFYKTGFMGMADNKPMCLLQGKYAGYLPEGCKSYLCELAQMAEENNNVHGLFKEFIESDRPDSFGYSRIIHILAHHVRNHEDMGLDRDNITLEQLRFLNEFVHRTTDCKSIYESLKKYDKE